MIAIIYFISGATTFVGGLLADRFNLKTIYLMGIFLQFPCYLGIAYISGYSLVVLCVLAAVFNASILPTENLLLGKFTPKSIMVLYMELSLFLHLDQDQFQYS